MHHVCSSNKNQFTRRAYTQNYAAHRARNIMCILVMYFMLCVCDTIVCLFGFVCSVHCVCGYERKRFAMGESTRGKSREILETNFRVPAENGFDW